MYEYKAYLVINFFGLKCCHPDVHSIIRAIPFKGGSIIYLGWEYRNHGGIIGILTIFKSSIKVGVIGISHENKVATRVASIKRTFKTQIMC